MIQTIINFIYRYPKAKLGKFSRFGGYFAYRRMRNESRVMEKKSVKLAPVHSDTDGLPVYFLTGKKYLYQTLFCIQSLSKISDTKFMFILVDDGSFDNEIINRISLQLPGARTVTVAEINKNLSKRLPEARFPLLHYKRKVYPHIKKLTDIHTLEGSSWKLVLDSDMLFWNKPIEIEEWLKAPNRPIHMLDCQESYGYSYPLMESLCGCKVQSLINVGAIGLNSEAINWEKLENWIEQLEKSEGKTYYLEQALSAMLIGETTSTVLDKAKYVVNPPHKDAIDDGQILHHYVDLSKLTYFTKSWRKFINN